MRRATRSSKPAMVGACTPREGGVRRLAVALRLLSTALVVSCAASCLDDSFDHPLSDEDSSQAEPRFVGTWKLVAVCDRDDPDAAGGASVCGIARHPRAAGLLQVRLLGGRAFRARPLTFGDRDFLFIHADDDPPRAEPAAAPRGWLVAYECGDASEPVVRVLAPDSLAKAIEAGDVDGTVERRQRAAILPWLRTTIVEPVVDIDSAKTRGWIAAHAATTLGRGRSVAEALDDVVRGPKTAFLASPPEAAEPPAEVRQLDERLLGTTIGITSRDAIDVYTVEKADGDGPPRYRCRFDEEPGEIGIDATEIDGLSLVTMTNAGPDGSAWIFRAEFLGPDILLLVAPEHAVVDAAVAGNLLPAREHPDAPEEHIVTASTEELRAVVEARAREFFPDFLNASEVYVFTRDRDRAGVAPDAR